MVRNFEGWNVVYMYYTFFVHSKEVLISDNNPVHSGIFIIIPTVSQLTYLFSGEVAALFSSYRLVYVI